MPAWTMAAAGDTEMNAGTDAVVTESGPDGEGRPGGAAEAEGDEDEGDDAEEDGDGGCGVEDDGGDDLSSDGDCWVRPAMPRAFGS